MSLFCGNGERTIPTHGGERGKITMGDTGGSICKTTPGKYATARVSLEAVNLIQKSEPGHLPICLPYNFLQWCG